MLTHGDNPLAVQHATPQGLHLPVIGPDAGILAMVLKDLSFALSEAATVLKQSALTHEVATLNIEQGIDFYREVDRFKICLILTALAHSDGCQKSAAKLLGIRLSTLNAMIKRFGICSKPDASSTKM